MAEEPEVEEKQGSPMIRYAVIGVIVLLVPTILAILVFQFILSPMLGGETLPAEPEIDIDAIPEGATPVPFGEQQGAVIPDDPDSPAPILLYNITFICDSPDTAALVQLPTTNAYMQAMLDKLHRNRTRSELNDPQVQTTILRRAEQEANTILKRSAPDGNHTILEVMYTKFAMVDL